MKRLALVALVLLGASGSMGVEQPISPHKPAPIKTARPTALSSLAPNEIGRVMVMMYHRIGAKNTPLIRTPNSFRGDLELLYQKGYRAVPLHDYLISSVHVPRGFSPVVLTFDDATPSQFHEIERNGRWVLDPDCTLGILESFQKAHPDFGLAATFYVVFPHPFGQPELSAEKLKYLVDHGFEIGNHTYHHPFLARLSRDAGIRDIAMCQAAMDKVIPGYRLDTLALPYGSSPRSRAIVREGEWHGVHYYNYAVMLAGGGPAPSPISDRFHPMDVTRVVGTRRELTRWLDFFDRHPLDRYVSDGSPDTITVPRLLLKFLNQRAISGRPLVVFDNSTPALSARRPRSDAMGWKSTASSIDRSAKTPEAPGGMASRSLNAASDAHTPGGMIRMRGSQHLAR